MNDLWKFNPTTNEWAWIAGSNVGNEPGVYGTLGNAAPDNIPGARDGAATWTDGSGNLWLFGGGGFDADDNGGLLNDLWEFNPSTLQWTWMGGSSAIGSQGGQMGVYGTLGKPAPGNIPGARGGATVWGR